MTAAVANVLSSFDLLSEEEQQTAAAEVLRRVSQMTPESIPDDAFVELAESQFRQLDAEEESDADAKSE